MLEMPSLLILTLLTMGSPVAASADTLSVARYLPESDDGGRWEQLQPVQVYRGRELYDLIDGGAVLYEEYGFTAAAATSYAKKGGGAVSVEIYEMKDEGAAFGVFTSVTGGLRDPGGRPGAIRFDGEYFLCFCKGRFFVTLTAQELDKWDAPLAASLLLDIGSRLPAASMDLPAPAMILESVFPSETPIVYMRGPIGLQSHAPAWFTRMVKGAEFGTSRTGSMITILAKTASEGEAAGVASRLAGLPGISVSRPGATYWVGTYAGPNSGIQPLAFAAERGWVVLTIGATSDSCQSALNSVRSRLRARRSPDGDKSQAP